MSIYNESLIVRMKKESINKTKKTTSMISIKRSIKKQINLFKTKKKDIANISFDISYEKIQKIYKGFVYKLTSRYTNKVCIGLTTSTLSIRLKSHKGNYKRFINKTGNYITSMELLKYKDVEIIALKEVVSRVLRIN